MKNLIQSNAFQEQITVDYKLDCLEIHPDIFVYEIGITYPEKSKIINSQLKLNEFHSGIATKRELEEYVKTKNIHLLPKKIYGFVNYDEANIDEKKKAEEEFISNQFDVSFPFERVWVGQDEDEDDEFSYQNMPVPIKIKDFLNNDGAVCPIKLEKLRIANDMERPFIYNSSLQLMASAIRFNEKNHVYISSKKYNLELLLKHLKTMDSVKIINGPHKSKNISYDFDDRNTEIIDIIYFLSPLETELFKKVYTQLNAIPVSKRTNYNFYQDPMDVFIYLDFLNIMQKDEIHIKTGNNWRYESDLEHYKNTIAIKEQTLLDMHIAPNQLSKEKFKL